MGRFIGIDFGTYRCAMAVLDGDSAMVIRTNEGEDSIPSTVAFSSRGILCGAAAEKQLVANPDGTVFSIKRLLGRKYHSAEVQWLAGSYPYPIVAALSGDAHVHVADEAYSPEEIASFLLEKMRVAAEASLRGPVDAVITVPGYWDELNRRAVLAAAKLAGLRVKSLINSTSAAAIMCGLAADTRQTIAVLDFGAGGFDVALVTTHPGGAEVVAVAGDPLLGGDDLDRRLVAHWLLRHREKSGEDLSGDPNVLSWLRGAAVAAKHELSYRDSIAEQKQHIMTSSGEDVELVLDALGRSEFAGLISDELSRLLQPLRWAFDDAQLGTDDVDAVFLVGGLARVPAVQEQVRMLFRKPPHALGTADHIVALGAARYSAALERRAGARFDLKEVVGCSTGIRVTGGQFVPVIRRNHPIPCREARQFRTARDDQERIVFDVFQGESEVAADNLYVGRFELAGLAGPQAGDRNLDTAFRLDRNGLLHIALCDARTGIDKDVPVERAGGLTDRQIAQLRAQRAQRTAPRPVSTDPPPTPRPERVVASTLTPLPPENQLRTRPPQTRPFGSTKVNTDPDGDTIEMESDALIGMTLSGRYVVEELIGEGGMGRVYRARHNMLDKDFAIKVLHPELASSRHLAQRFIEEARAASSIKSRHVIDISDFGALPDGTGFFVMEYLNGRTLHDLMGDDEAVDLPRLLSIGVQLAEGLSDAHELDIVHRDLKPANVMCVARKDGLLRCIILDFGIAKRPTSHSGGAVTHAGVMVGTPEYMAPEQIQRGSVDGRSDIYSLGVILYELAAGRRPFDAEATAELLMQQVYERARPILSVFPEAEITPEVEAIIMRCLEKEPARRYKTAHQLAEVLRGAQLAVT
jgi:molecular chaperone DnaK